jgi:hypothetical protein
MRNRSQCKNYRGVDELGHKPFRNTALDFLSRGLGAWWQALHGIGDTYVNQFTIVIDASGFLQPGL